MYILSKKSVKSYDWQVLAIEDTFEAIRAFLPRKYIVDIKSDYVLCFKRGNILYELRKKAAIV